MARRSPTRTHRVNDLRKQASNIKSEITTLDSEYTAEEVNSSPISSPRQTRLIEYHIHCEMCDTNDAIAIRYPGQPPRICDNCYSKYKTPGAAKAALWDKQHPEEAAARKHTHARKQKIEAATLQKELKKSQVFTLGSHVTIGKNPIVGEITFLNGERVNVTRPNPRGGFMTHSTTIDKLKPA